VFFFFQAEDVIRDFHVTGVQTCALPISFGYLIQHSSHWSFWRSSDRAVKQRADQASGKCPKANTSVSKRPISSCRLSCCNRVCSQSRDNSTGITQRCMPCCNRYFRLCWL